MKRRNAVTGMLAAAAALTTGLTVADSCIVEGSTDRAPSSVVPVVLEGDFASGWAYDFGSDTLDDTFLSDNPGMMIICR